MASSKSHRQTNKNTDMVKIVGMILFFSGLLTIGITSSAWFLLKTPQEKLDSLNVEYIAPAINNSMVVIPTEIIVAEKQLPEIVSSPEPAKSVTIKKSDLLEDSQTLIKHSNLPVENFSRLLDGYSDDKLLKKIAPKSWSDPNWLLPDQYGQQQTNLDLTNFRLIDESNINMDLLAGLPEKISIPFLNIVAPVENLGITVKDGRQVYETPKNLVGRIPHSPKEPDSFKGWYFGHLESPIKGEGNVFHDLPKIAEHLLNGDKVLISLEKSDKELIYQAIKSEVVHESNLVLYDAGNKNIILVTCSNRPLYDHRQVVTATLVGFIE